MMGLGGPESTGVSSSGAEPMACRLSQVDLAGSERYTDACSSGARRKEACSINRSLSALGNVMGALVGVAQGQTRHVPYRESKLTLLLRCAACSPCRSDGIVAPL